MNDTKGRKASWEELDELRTELTRRLRIHSGLSRMEFLMSEECHRLWYKAHEELCLHLGWSIEEHDKVESDEVMAQVQAMILAEN